MKNILLIYGHALSHCALKALVNDDHSVHLADEAGSVHDAMLKIREHTYDVIILDVSAAETNGLEVFCDLKQAFPDLPVLIINGSERVERMIHFIRLGCAGYLSYTTDSAQVIPAINAIARGQAYVSPQHQQMAANSEPMLHERLSLRELQVFFKLIKGQAVNSIAMELEIAPGSVSVFRSKILKKMHVLNNAALIYYALKYHLAPVAGATSKSAREVA
ncbi:LuxR C-terminal-related transcriptional regulator [Methylophilus sp. UBA6697]|jgi:DNA-binding NarL/FixJ family response regulator|uniref:LuxR C-terminal-related transcriptional regulator n=1 Tax=Methylophilus sp. UBA6697 TaxID=1946902 RepID=UPI0025FAED77|nr:response regulator transcription factor [Methylophilus sp. UBA6697]